MRPNKNRSNTHPYRDKPKQQRDKPSRIILHEPQTSGDSFYTQSSFASSNGTSHHNWNGNKSKRVSSSTRSKGKFRLMSGGGYMTNRGRQSKSFSSFTENSRQSTFTATTATTATSYMTGTVPNSPAKDENEDVISPCDGDPFWDYYRIIGDLSRANSYELINVMKFISAEHIIKFFLQNWLQTRLQPSDLPYCNDAILSKMQYTKRLRKRYNHPKRPTISHYRTQSQLNKSNLKQHDVIYKPMRFNYKNPRQSIKSFTMSNSGTYKFDATSKLQYTTAETDEFFEEDDYEEYTDDEYSKYTNNNGYDVKSTYTAQSRHVSIMEHDNFDLNLHSSSLMRFVGQSLKVTDETSRHPSCFDIKWLTSKAKKLRGLARVFLNKNKFRYQNWTAQQLYFSEDNEKWNDDMNDIGSHIFSFLDQRNFLNAQVVSRSWFYVSRFEGSRSNIQFRLWNVLKALIKHKDLLKSILSSNEIISVDEYFGTLNNNGGNGSKNKAKNDSNKAKLEFQNEMKEQKSGSNDDGSQDLVMFTDILLSCVNPKRDKSAENRYSTIFENILYPPKSPTDANDIGNANSTRANMAYNFPYFFSNRTQCGLFSSVCVLQIDLTIVSDNCLMYYIDSDLYDCFWETALTLFRIENLKHIDLVLPDPHILLLQYLINNHSKKLVNDGQKVELKFPSIGIPKGKFLCISKQIAHLAFKCKTLSRNKLITLLDTHFSHYYHPSHHNNINPESYSEFSKFLKTQSSKQFYSKLDIYLLCKKTISKPMLFDITHALYYMNRRPIDCVSTVQTLIMSDVKCTDKELQSFLIANGQNLRRIEITFSDLCIDPKNVGNHNGGGGSFYNNRTPSLATLSTIHSNGSDSRGSSNKSQLNQPLPVRSPVISKSKSTTQFRIMGIVNATMKALVGYLNSEIHRLHEYNKRIRKKFQKHSVTAHSPSKYNNKKFHRKHMQYSNNSNRHYHLKEEEIEKQFISAIRVLPLKCLALSLPSRIEDEMFMESLFDVFKVFETQCDELRLNELYLNGACLSTQSLFRVNFAKIFNAQEISKLYFRQMLYDDALVNTWNKVWMHELVDLDLSMSFLSDNKDIKHLFATLEKCCCLKHLSLEFKQQPIIDNHNNVIEVEDHTVETAKSIASAETRSSGISNPENKAIREPTMFPSLDIWWIHHFVVSKHIKKTLVSIKLTFRELSTRKFLQNQRGLVKYVRFNQTYGQILRIADQFKKQVEQLIMSWFGECNHLVEAKMLRKLSYSHNNDHASHEHNDDNIAINFNLDMECFKDREAYLSHLDSNEIHDLVLYKIKKWKVGNVYKGDVVGELERLLMPEIPLG